MKYYNKKTKKTYNSFDEMIDEVYEIIDDINILIDTLNSFHLSKAELWNKLSHNTKGQLYELTAENYIKENIEGMEE